MSSPARPSPPRFDVGDRILAGIVRSFIAVVGVLPPDRVVAMGAFIGRCWFRLSLPRAARVREQLALAFPDLDSAQLDARAQGVFIHLGRGLSELLILAGRNRNVLIDRVEIEGLPNLTAAEAISPDGGVLVATAHLGNWELAAAAIARHGIALSVVYHGLARRSLDEALTDLRGGGPAGPETGIEQLRLGRAGLGVLGALRRGRKVLLLLDQDAGRDEGLFVPFFGRLASTRDAPVRIALKRGIPILPAFASRTPDGRGHRVSIQPALQLDADRPDDEETVRRNLEKVSLAIEGAIRETPDQWIWTHRRWRTQPLDPSSGSAGAVSE